MPGFSIAGQGQGPNSLSEVRRQHRWLFQSSTLLNPQLLLVLKTASRPSLTMGEAVMHHNQEEVYFAGKNTWEAISLTWYDVENAPDVSRSIWDWTQKCLILTGANAASVTPPSTYKATTSILQMVDGMGTPTENWEIYNGWPQQCNWGTLDYSSNEIATVECKFRFDRAVRSGSGSGASFQISAIGPIR